MKLIQKIALRLSMVLIPVIALWAMIFYFVTVEEINDEVDDLLRSYSEQLIAKKLANQELPVADIIAGMHYSISQVTEEYADSQSEETQNKIATHHLATRKIHTPL